MSSETWSFPSFIKCSCISALRVSYNRMESSLPKHEDVQGAAQGLMRLQDVYGLQVEGLARGHFQRTSSGNVIDIYKPEVSTPLSGDDCFLVGKVGHVKSLCKQGAKCLVSSCLPIHLFLLNDFSFLTSFNFPIFLLGKGANHSFQCRIA